MSFFWHSPRLSLPEQTGGFFSCLSIIPHFFEKCKGFCKIFFQPHDFFYFCIWKRCWLQKMSHLFEILFPITSRRQTKSFSVQQFFKNAAEVWASSPHLRSKFVFENCCSCCNCIYENCPICNLISFMRQVANSDKATGQLQHAGRQKQGWNPLLPDEKDRFS